jgi:hypothetical protein
VHNSQVTTGQLEHSAEEIRSHLFDMERRMMAMMQDIEARLDSKPAGPPKGEATPLDLQDVEILKESPRVVLAPEAAMGAGLGFDSETKP